MKHVIASLAALLLIAGTAHAQQGIPPEMMQQMQKLQNMSAEEQQQYMQDMMQKAMQGAQQMQNCFNEAGGEAAFKKLQTKAEAAEAQVKQLCAAGKRRDAERFAMKFGKEMQNDPTISKLQECSKEMTAKWEKSPFIAHSLQSEKKSVSKHICDI